MALQKSIATTRLGIGFAAAYGRIDSITFLHRRSGVRFIIDVTLFAQDPGADDEVIAVDTFRYFGQLNDLPAAANPINRGYLYLKTLPEWSTAVDV